MPEIAATLVMAPGAGPGETDGRAARMARAAAARAGARAAADPAQVVPRPVRPGAALSRRDLLAALRRPPLHVIPAAQRGACRADRGCRLCVATCPERAMAPGPEGIRVNGAACTGCGACLAACPLGALTFPPYTGGGLEAQLRALLDGPRDARDVRIIVFRCEGNPIDLGRPWINPGPTPDTSHSGGTGFMPVRPGSRARSSFVVAADAEGGRWQGPAETSPVPWPCVGALPADAVLRAHALGADGVAVAPCAPSCAHRLSLDGLVARAAFLRAFLASIGLAGRMAMLEASEDAMGAFVDAVRGLGPTGLRMAPPSRTPALLRGLAARRAAPALVPVPAAAVPLGRIRLKDPAACTLCRACADRCPMGALTLRQEGSVRALAFAHAVCSGCADCAPACPEKILTVEPSCDVAALAAPPVVLARSAVVRCARCAAEIGPAAMLQRVHALLRGGGVHAAATPTLCPACRLLGAGPPGRSA